MKYFEFLNILVLIALVCVGVLTHAHLTGLVDFNIVVNDFIQMAKSL